MLLEWYNRGDSSVPNKIETQKTKEGGIMITRKNLKDVIAQISEKDKKRIRNTSKEYIILGLHCFNAGSYTTVKCTDMAPNKLHYTEYILYSNDPVFEGI